MTADEQISFLTKLQRLLGEGSFVATYKYALLLALADISVEGGHDDDRSLEITTQQIAEKFIQYYWRQTAPYAGGRSDTGMWILRQNTGNQAGVVRSIVATRDAVAGSMAQAQHDRHRWRRLVVKVDQIVREMPLWKLQTVGSQKLEFLYANVGQGTVVTLKPGVAYCLRQHYGLVSDLVQGAWARYIRRFNHQMLGVGADLHEFLFGSERSVLAKVVPILSTFQEERCFYCEGALRKESVHVDHFIPWSRYPLDLGHNLVLSHDRCNAKKSDRLGALPHLKHWATDVGNRYADLSREFDRCGIRHDWPTSVRIVDWAYRQAYRSGGLTWLRGDDLQPLPEEWQKLLQDMKTS